MQRGRKQSAKGAHVKPKVTNILIREGTHWAK